MVDKLISDLVAGIAALNTEIEILLNGATISTKETIADILDLQNAETKTLTNKTIDLGANTITGTLAEFNTALQVESFVSLAGTETLTNKTLTSPTFTTPVLGVPSSGTLDADNLTCTNFDIGAEVPLVIPTAINQDIYIGAGSMNTRTTNGAAFAALELATNDVMLESFDFDTTTSEGVGFWWHPPENWDAGTITFKPFWTAASGSGTFICGLSGRSYTNSDALDQAPETGVQTSTDTLLTANDMHIGPESSAITITNATAGELCYFEVTRDISDTLDVDAKLIGIRIRYKIDNLASA